VVQDFTPKWKKEERERLSGGRWPFLQFFGSTGVKVFLAKTPNNEIGMLLGGDAL
jgi:hypothetical protein